MKLLQDKVMNDAKVLPGDIVQVGGFLNHQIDVKLMKEIGKEFNRVFSEYRPTKILTIEAAGIAIATATADIMDINFVFAKKHKGVDLVNAEGGYSANVNSFTKKQEFNVRVSRDFIGEGDRILIIDDFLANGDAALGLVEICRQAKADIVGIGICIEKSFSPGAGLIEQAGIKLHSLVRIASLADGKVTLV